MFDCHVPIGHLFVGGMQMKCLKMLHQVVDDRVHKLSSLVANQSVHTAKTANNGVQNVATDLALLYGTAVASVHLKK